MVDPENRIGQSADNGGMTEATPQSEEKPNCKPNGKPKPHPVRFSISNWIGIVGLLGGALWGIWEIVDAKVDNCQTKEAAAAAAEIIELKQKLIDQKQRTDIDSSTVQITTIRDDVDEVKATVTTQTAVLDAMRDNIEVVVSALTDERPRRINARVRRDVKRILEPDKD